MKTKPLEANRSSTLTAHEGRGHQAPTHQSPMEENKDAMSSDSDNSVVIDTLFNKFNDADEEEEEEGNESGLSNNLLWLTSFIISNR